MSGFGYLTSAQALQFLPPCQSDGAVYGAAAYACQESGEWRETLRLLRMLRDSWLSPISLWARNIKCSSRNLWKPGPFVIMKKPGLQHSQPKLWSLQYLLTIFSVVSIPILPLASLHPGPFQMAKNAALPHEAGLSILSQEQKQRCDTITFNSIISDWPFQRAFQLSDWRSKLTNDPPLIRHSLLENQGTCETTHHHSYGKLT